MTARLFPHQIKFEKPSTRMAMPVNCSTSAKLLSNATMYSGIADAMAKGPNPWVKETEVDATIARVFHFGDQLSGSLGSSDG